MAAEPLRVGYVVKRYPRYSETFIVTEILAHEAAGLEIDIFSLHPSHDDHYQDAIAHVRADVHYLLPPAAGTTPKAFATDGVKAADLWETIQEAASVLPGLWSGLEKARGMQAMDLYHGVLLAREVRLRGITHLHAHFASTATAVARLAANFAEVPYTFTAHAKDIFHESVRTDHLRLAIEDAAAVITVSDYNLAHLRQTYGTPTAKIRHLYNGLALELFPFETPVKRSPEVISVARLIEKKGIEDLISACVVLVGRGSQFSCQIIGTGPLKEKLRAQIRDLRLQETVELIGPRRQAEVIRHIQRAAVFAGPYVVGADGNREGIPTVLLEAMALGTPCVATDVTGIPEVVRHNETGLMVPEHAPEALADAIERLIADPQLRVRLATNARRLVEAEFDTRRNSARLREIFNSCAGRERIVCAAE